MGIPCFYSYIIKNHTNIINELKTNLNNLYVDGNSIIYDAVNEISKIENIPNDIESEIIKRLIKKLVDLINNVNPSHKCFITFDGVAPLAKLNQQRIRRFKSSYEKDILNDIENIEKKTLWNTSAITPGTHFMQKMTSKIKFVNFNIATNKNIEFIISSSDEPGEGEHKIFKYIRDNYEYHMNTDTVIYGLDADLIMLSLNHTDYCKNIYLYRETPSFIKNINRDLDPNKNYLLNISKLSTTISNDFKDKNRIKDYIFLCFLLGNDFMPHMPSINIRTDGIDVLLNYYKEYIVKKNIYLVSNNKIVWKNFKILIEKLSEEENNRLQKEYNIRNKFRLNKTSIEEKLLMLPMLDRNIETYINPFETKWQQRYYSKLFNTSNVRNNNIIKEICTNYLEAIEWTFNYYNDDCSDWRWKYNFSYAPLLSDLKLYIPYFNSDFIKKNINKPVNSYVQLCYVLPRDCKALLPEKLQSYMNDKHKEYYSNIKLVWAFCKFFWESKIEFSDLDINILENDIKLLLVE